MRIIEKTVPANFNYFLCGDNHEGSVLQYSKGVDKFFDMLESPWDGVMPRNNFAWHSGDHIEGIVIDDPRYDPRVCTEPIATEQNKVFIKKWKPIAKKLIGMNEGNHPWKLHKFGNLTSDACKALGIEYGTFRSIVIFKDRKGRVIFKAYHTHGRKLIRSYAEPEKRKRANRELILQRQLSSMAGDCLLQSKGHTHQLIVSRPQPVLYIAEKHDRIKAYYTNPDQLEVVSPTREFLSAEQTPSGFIHPDNRWYVNTGSFLRTIRENIVTYQEALELPPTALGFAIVEVRDRKIKDIKEVVL